MAESQPPPNRLLQRRGVHFGSHVVIDRPGTRLERRVRPSSSLLSLHSEESSQASIIGKTHLPPRDLHHIQDQEVVSTVQPFYLSSSALSPGSFTNLNPPFASHQHFSSDAAYADSQPLPMSASHLLPLSEDFKLSRSGSSHSRKQVLNSPFPLECAGTFAYHSPTQATRNAAEPSLSADTSTALHSDRNGRHSQGLSCQGDFNGQILPWLEQSTFHSPLLFATASGQLPSSEVYAVPEPLWEGQAKVFEMQSGVQGESMSSLDMNYYHQQRASIGPQKFVPELLYQQEQADWDVYRTNYGHATSAASNHNSSASSEESGRKHPSRAYLQKKVNDLKAEMVYLKERVHSADTKNKHRDEQQVSYSGSEHVLATSHNHGHQEHKGQVDELRDCGMAHEGRDGSVGSHDYINERIHPFETLEPPSNNMILEEMSSWRQQQPWLGSSQSQTSATNLSSMGSTQSNASTRKGTWRTQNGSNTLFYTAGGMTNLESNNQTSLLKEDTDKEEQLDDDPNKRFKCPRSDCSKRFTTSGHAHRHERSHMGHRLFGCPHQGCTPTFTRRDNCRQHQRARHDIILPVYQICD